jgi:hypothetical protein
MNASALNGSRSSKCSPVPKNTIGLVFDQQAIRAQVTQHDTRYLPVAATALSAPPPLAWPSILVITTEPTGTAALNASACVCLRQHAYNIHTQTHTLTHSPAVVLPDQSTHPTQTRRHSAAPALRSARAHMSTLESHCIASRTCCISWNSPSSCLCRPDVSTRMISYF